MFKRPVIIFFSLSIFLALVFFLFPINIFDGVIVYQQGLQKVEVETPLSLSYFIGLNLYPENMEGVVADFYLTTKGKVMAVIYILGVPGLIAYRVLLRR